MNIFSNRFNFSELKNDIMIYRILATRKGTFIFANCSTGT